MTSPTPTTRRASAPSWRPCARAARSGLWRRGRLDRGSRRAVPAQGGPCTVSQHVFETPKIARHVAVDERDPDARVDREHVVLPDKHVGGRIGLEELLHAEPPHDATPHPLGERGQMDLSNRPGRQKHWRGAAVCAMWRPLQDGHTPRPMHENASGGLKGASRRKLPWQPNAIRSKSSAVAMRVRSTQKRRKAESARSSRPNCCGTPPLTVLMARH